MQDTKATPRDNINDAALQAKLPVEWDRMRHSHGEKYEIYLLSPGNVYMMLNDVVSHVELQNEMHSSTLIKYRKSLTYKIRENDVPYFQTDEII